MRFGASVVIAVCACAALVGARRPPNADYVEKYFGRSGPEGGRFSDNLLEDAQLDVPNLIRKYGYPSEVHEVVTEDGYILELHRIPYGRDQNNAPHPEKPVVFVLHGLLSSSADWVLMGPGTALGYALAEAGFDVWLGNARGNYYSRRHVTLDPDNDNTYWRFSWEEFGRFDIPAVIDHILETTGKDRLHYIGHSQGTTSFFVFGALRPEYMSKIITMQAYAPVAYMHYNTNPVFVAIAPYVNTLETVASILGINELLGRPSIATTVGQSVCADDSELQPVCTQLIFLLGGYGPDQHNATMFPVKLAHTPAGAALRQFIHYGQLIGQDFFRRYDHGPITNLVRYGSITPPLLDLGRITAPVFLHYVDPDTFAAMRDVDRLWRELGNPVAKIRVASEPFSHLDFMWGQNATGMLYDRTTEIMKLYGNN